MSSSISDIIADIQQRQKDFNRLYRERNLHLPSILCCLCDKVIKDDPFGHNASPLAEGQCCGACNGSKVIPARMNASKSIKRRRQ